MKFRQIPSFILVVAFVVASCKGCKPNDDNAKQLQILQQKFDSLANEINGYKDSLKRYDDAIVDLKMRDSELTGQLQANKAIQIKIKRDYDQVNRHGSANSAEITKYFAELSPNDTSITCLPNNQLREMIRLNEIRKVQTRELAAVKDQVDLLEQKVAVKDTTISAFEKRIIITNKMTAAYDLSLANLNNQIVVHKSINDQLKRDLKTANKKRVMNKFFYGGIAAVALVLLAIK